MKNASERRKSGLFWVGAGLLYVCSLLWLFSIIRIIVKPENAVDEILGMNILTITPILIGIYLIWREMKLRAREEEFRYTNCGFVNRGDSELCKSCGAYTPFFEVITDDRVFAFGVILATLGFFWLIFGQRQKRRKPKGSSH